ncbi:MAG: GntR family transcriptional regulator [Chloroflexi bacterium]|nr:GntR family transcriptional regulator [Chloroflexota bacterium]
MSTFGQCEFYRKPAGASPVSTLTNLRWRRDQHPGERSQTVTSNNGLTPLETETIATRVFRQLQKAIYAGQLKPGERLVEANLAEALQVSRASVREALYLLQSKGLVTTRHRRGTYVIELSDADIRDIYSLRILLETYAVRLAAEVVTDEDIEHLQKLIDDLREVAKLRKHEQIVDLDLRFHLEICRFARNKRLLDTWRSMESALRAFLLLKYGLYDDSPEIANSHQPLIDALRQRDPDKAEAVLRSHISETAEHVLHSLEEEKLVENIDQTKPGKSA